MDFLIFGTVWFWVLTFVTGGIIIFLMEDALTSGSDTGGGVRATITLLIYFGLYAIFGSSEHIGNLFSFIKNNAGITLFLLGSYFFLGVIWAIAKWYFYVLGKRDEFRADKYGDRNPSNYMPVAGKNKARILSWMTYWPFSALWTLINDPVRRAFKIIYNRIESYFDKMSKRMFSTDEEKYKLKLDQEKEKALRR